MDSSADFITSSESERVPILNASNSSNPKRSYGSRNVEALQIPSGQESSAITWEHYEELPRTNDFTTEERNDAARFATYHPFKKWIISIISLEGFRTARLAFQSVGVIYGDIGTSPLYVFSAIFSDTPAPTDVEVFGALSLAIWSLFLIFIVKYVVIVLCADDNGEGGTFALYSLICRYCDIVARGSKSTSDLALTHYNTDDFGFGVPCSPRNHNVPLHAKVRRYVNESLTLQGILLLTVLFGTSLVMGDGVLTPAVSVLSAVEGVKIAFPLMEPFVVPVTVGIIFGLFMSQSMGTNRVAKLFAPVIVLWLSCLAAIGVYNILQYPAIIKAVSPVYAYRYFVIRGWSGWTSLGGILLTISGVEALFADLGHFNRTSIRLSATTMVLPALLLTYMGQAAQIVLNPHIVDSVFWKSIPKPVYWPMLVVATCAAVVASQAMVSAAFSIVHQAMALGCFPKIRVVHTSRKIHGQVFVPEISWLLMTLSIGLVITFQESKSLTAAYGLASCLLMFLTTCLISLVMVVVWKVRLLFVIIFFIVFAAIDLAFLSSTFLKITSGGWIPLAFALVFSSIMNLWRWANDLKYYKIKDVQVPLNSLLYDPAYGSLEPETDSPSWLLKAGEDSQPVARVPGLALFYSEADTDVPAVFTHTLNCFSSVPEMVVFVTVRVVVVPSVLPKERFLVTRLPISGFYRCVARYGYMDMVEDGDSFVKSMIRELEANTLKAINAASRGQVASPKSPSKAKVNVLNRELDLLLTAPRHGVTFVLGKSLCSASAESGLFRRAALNYAFHFLANNDRSFCLTTPPEKTIQVGIPLQI
ncbi:putative potassium transporter 3 [Entomophthora muscae]|uniref:Potassium transporter 3 n=1 Tax=Entomophthora muscae TaxID=34485 RepID=A0ACC2RND2_9FUNG|nr:putative potassium transporter 3 [Entomophthora muscae]